MQHNYTLGDGHVVPFVCGGRLRVGTTDWEFQPKSWRYNPGSCTWEGSPWSRHYKLFCPASAFHHSLGFVFSGGNMQGSTMATKGQQRNTTIHTKRKEQSQTFGYALDGQSFTAFPSMPVTKLVHCAVVLKGGKEIFVTGGEDTLKTSTTRWAWSEIVATQVLHKRLFPSLLLDVESNIWTECPEMPTGRSGLRYGLDLYTWNIRKLRGFLRLQLRSGA